MKLFREFKEAAAALQPVKLMVVFSDGDQKSYTINKDVSFKDYVEKNIAPEEKAKNGRDVIHYELVGHPKNKEVTVTSVTNTVKEDLDSAYSDWQDSVKKQYPQHAEKIRFVSKPDAPHQISAEVKGMDRSFGVFDHNKGEGQVLGESHIDEACECSSKAKKESIKAAAAGSLENHKKAAEAHTKAAQMEEQVGHYDSAEYHKRQANFHSKLSLG